MLAVDDDETLVIVDLNPSVADRGFTGQDANAPGGPLALR